MKPSLLASTSVDLDTIDALQLKLCHADAVAKAIFYTLDPKTGVSLMPPATLHDASHALLTTVAEARALAGKL